MVSLCVCDVSLWRGAWRAVCLLIPAAVLCRLWKWQVIFAPCCSLFSFPLEITGKQRQWWGASTLGRRRAKSFWEHLCRVCASLAVPAAVLCPGKGRNSIRVQRGSCTSVLPTFPNYVNSMLRSGVVALLQLLCYVEGDNVPWPHIHTFSQIWLPLLSSHERIKSTETWLPFPFLPPPSHKPWEEHCLLLFFEKCWRAQAVAIHCIRCFGIRSGQLLPCSCFLAGMWQRAWEKGEQCYTSEMRQSKRCVPAAPAQPASVCLLFS